MSCREILRSAFRLQQFSPQTICCACRSINSIGSFNSIVSTTSSRSIYFTPNHYSSQTLPFSPLRPFSTDQTSSNSQDEESLKTELLNRALKHVPELGWSHSTLERAARELNLSPNYIKQFQNGVGDLIDHFNQLGNQYLEKELNTTLKQRFEQARTKERLFLLIKARLLFIIQNGLLALWPQALALGGQINTLPLTMKRLAHLVDEMWHYVGDTSTQMDWYCKRGNLAMVYVLTELCLLTDRSPNQEYTWAFLKRRLDEMEFMLTQPPQYVQQMQDYLAMVGRGILAILEEQKNAGRYQSKRDDDYGHNQSSGKNDNESTILKSVPVTIR